jgi:hypothetical protein
MPKATSVTVTISPGKAMTITSSKPKTQTASKEKKKKPAKTKPAKPAAAAIKKPKKPAPAATVKKPPTLKQKREPVKPPAKKPRAATPLKKVVKYDLGKVKIYTDGTDSNGGMFFSPEIALRVNTDRIQIESNANKMFSDMTPDWNNLFNLPLDAEMPSSKSSTPSSDTKPKQAHRFEEGPALMYSTASSVAKPKVKKVAYDLGHFQIYTDGTTSKGGMFRSAKAALEAAKSGLI